MVRRTSMILALAVFGGIIAFRVYNWGADVKGFVDSENQKQAAHFSNSIVDPLNEATKSVDAMHALLRRASDPAADKRRGLLALLKISGSTVPDGIAEARKGVQRVEASSGEEARAVLVQADALLKTYEGFVPVHAELAEQILESTDATSALTRQVHQRLDALEAQKSDAIAAFTKVQHEFLR